VSNTCLAKSEKARQELFHDNYVKNFTRTGRVKYWQIINDNLKKLGWSLGYASAIDSGRLIGVTLVVSGKM
jgi:hypothetical protein